MSNSICIGKRNNRVRKAENESFDRHRKMESKALLYKDIFKGRIVRNCTQKKKWLLKLAHFAQNKNLFRQKSSCEALH